jgi:lysophospholipase L1-like esterase
MTCFLGLTGALVLAVIFACGSGSADEQPLRLPPECVPRGGLPNALRKLGQRGEVRIAYLGGSITKSPGWRTMTEEWFQQQHPQATVTAINAGISGTGSDLGVFRLERDVLRHDPDLLFVEFTGNDGGTSGERIRKSMEGIVRKARRAKPDLDICFVFVVWQWMTEGLRRGDLPHTYIEHTDIAEHYGIPTIHMGLEVARLEKEGKLLFTGKLPQTEEEKAALGDSILFSGDGIHPYDAGHALYAEAVARSAERMKGIGEPGPHSLPDPFREDNFEYAEPIPLDRAELSAGWRKLDVADDAAVRQFLGGSEFGDKLDTLWLAEEPGESISFRFRGTSVMVYDMVGPDCGQIIVTLDDEEPKTIPRFDSWCVGHRVTVMIAATDLRDEVHTIRFEIDDEQPDKVKLLAERGVTMDDPARYDGTKWYAGSLLVTGELLD